MKANRIKTRIITLAMAAVTTFTVASTAVTPAYAANSLPSNIFHLTGEMKTKADSIENALVCVSKLPFFKDTAVAYFGPMLTILDVYFGNTPSSLGDISKKLDDINKEIQGKITKEADRVIDAMDAIPDAVNVTACKNNITALKRSIKTAQTNIKVDIEDEDLTDEQKFREVAKELGNDPSDWGLGSTVNGIEVLASNISVNSKDMATAVAENSTDNIYLSMYRYQCSKSLLSGEAIDKSADFVNTTYGVYLNSATTLLQYLYAKAEVATIDGDKNMLKKVTEKIDSVFDDMIEANKAYGEFFSLNRLVYVNHKADATKQIPLSNTIGHVNYKANQVQDIDAVFNQYSAITYDDVNAIINQGKGSQYLKLKDYLNNLGFNMGLTDAEIAKNYNNFITSKYFITGATCSVPWHFKFKGVELNNEGMNTTDVQYYQHRKDKDTFAIYDRRYMDGNGLYFQRDVEHNYQITAWKNGCTIDGIEVEFTDKNTGEKRTAKSSNIIRVDDGRDETMRTYTITVYLDGKEYTDTRDVAVPDYEIVSWKPNGDFSKASVNLRCTDCGKIATVEASELTRVDDNSEPMKRTYTVKVMIEGKEYTDTREFQVKNYEFVDNGNNTATLVLNWGAYNNNSIDWSKAGGKEAVTAIKINKGVSIVGDCSNFFNGLTNCESIEAENLVTDRAMRMNGMFCGCAALKELDLSNFETWFVNDMTGMFSGCNALETLDLANFDTTGCGYHIERMFENCTSLQKLTLSAKINVTPEMCLIAKSDNFRGWANENDLGNIITGRDKVATISGAGTYIHVAY